MKTRRNMGWNACFSYVTTPCFGLHVESPNGEFFQEIWLRKPLLCRTWRANNKGDASIISLGWAATIPSVNQQNTLQPKAKFVLLCAFNFHFQAAKGDPSWNMFCSAKCPQKEIKSKQTPMEPKISTISGDSCSFSRGCLKSWRSAPKKTGFIRRHRSFGGN